MSLEGFVNHFRLFPVTTANLKYENMKSSFIPLSIYFVWLHFSFVESFRSLPLCTRLTMQPRHSSVPFVRTPAIRLSSENTYDLEGGHNESPTELSHTEDESNEMGSPEDLVDHSVAHQSTKMMEDSSADDDSCTESDCPCNDFGCEEMKTSTTIMGDQRDPKQNGADTIAVEYRRTFERLRDRDYRRRMYRNIHTGFSSALRHLLRNIREGELGKRGEEWVVVQGLLVFSILGGVHPIFRSLLFLSGLLSTVSGLYLMAHALSDLGELTTPFAPPVQASVVVENGVYRMVRHPMYGGLLLLCGGLSILSGAVEKLVLTLGLAWLLVSARSSLSTTSSSEQSLCVLTEQASGSGGGTVAASPRGGVPLLHGGQKEARSSIILITDLRHLALIDSNHDAISRWSLRRHHHLYSMKTCK